MYLDDTILNLEKYKRNNRETTKNSESFVRWLRKLSVYSSS